MTSVVVDGYTLGEKHKSYNKLVNEAVKNNPTQQITALNYDDPDLDNLYRIDVACNIKNVAYILEALKSEDMLYVSRVIKQSKWLITDHQYSSIINPDYLHNNLSPQMTTKAFNKLILHIRLNLEDENRVEEFFNYYKEKDLQKSLKWLPRCSNTFIENIIRKHAHDIKPQIMNRLYKKSITFLEIFLRSFDNDCYHYKGDFIKPAMFLVKQNVEKFLDIVEESDEGYMPGFGPNSTKTAMENYSERIMKNLERYVHILHIPTFAKFIRNEDAKDFILTYIKNLNMRYWFNHQNIKYFLNRMPKEEVFDFIKKYFIEKSYDKDDLNGETWYNIVEQCSPYTRNASSSKSIYSWYSYAPFNRAFDDLIRLIRNESNPAERFLIFSVMLTCASSDMQNVLMILKYYREHHINEPFKFKMQFVNLLISKTDTHKYSNEAWGYLNELFNSMELYMTFDHNLQSCVRCIIVYNVINGKNIPEVLENKFVFENLDNKVKFTVEEREKIFNYLYKYLTRKIMNDLKTEKDFEESVNNIIEILNLLKSWNKDLKDYPYILQKIKELIVIKKENSWNQDLSGIYNVKKSWRKLLLSESILLNPAEDSCINALKYCPQLLDIYREEINTLFINDNMFLERFLLKIRIYWYQPLAKSIKTTLLKSLNQKSSHVALIKGICTLLSRKEIFDFIQKYVPTEFKIDWSQPDNLELCIRKCIAKSMHIARPQPALTLALMYAKGDYLQYVLPSLNAILYNSSAAYICVHIPTLLNTPVSLQQHGIRAAFSKLKHEELKYTFSNIWKSNQNSTIRTVIFCQTFNKLCKETDESVILETWDLLSTFIENLTTDENKKIYLTLTKSNKVPLSVRGAFWMKSYDFLKKLPATANCNSLVDDLKSQMDEVMETLDADFMAKFCFENFDHQFTTQDYAYTYQVSLYLLSTKTETAQNERYEKIFIPILEKAIAMWDKQHENVYYARFNLNAILACMSREFESVVLKKNMMIPIAMYTAVLNKLRSSLPAVESYTILTNVKLSLGYMQILHDISTNAESDFTEKKGKNQDDIWTDLHANAAPIFGRLCLNYLKEDVKNHFPSIYFIFAEILDNIFSRYSKSDLLLIMLKEFLESKDFIEGYFLVMKLMPTYLYKDSEKVLRHDLLDIISHHPSEEVAMQYWLMRCLI
ncbi:uncharacterized protein LOC112055210 [Bicyclus anynana]|uniref:Uncharacterized protein LOC112055210 n=1 Tax=Bicyclus anynana TaxID=110368 RepID=A0A6J1P1A2_BICAN|nr:uncharacterized protein LOC112055210 [Bicyclus anynana]